MGELFIGFNIINQLIYWAYVLLIFVVVVVLIMNNRTPQKTVTWIIVLVVFPVIGLILYYFFGYDSRKQRLISKRSLSLLSQKSLRNYETLSRVELPQEYVPLIRFFKNVSLSMPFSYNEVKAYTDGFSMLQSLLREISMAKDHIHIQFYIFADDAVGRLVRDALIDKAAQGIEVRLLYDDVGCWSVHKKFFECMRENGIETQAFLKVHFPSFTSKVNYRNHRKMVIIDGKVGFIGGMNIANRYMKGVPWGCWRDTQLLIRGSAVNGLQTSFLMDWFFVDRSLITAKKYFPPLERDKGALIQIVTSQPVGPWRDIMQGLIMIFNQSHRYLYIQTPYFLPTESLYSSLQNAALAGVDVRLMIPQRSDSVFTQFASSSYLGEILRSGVKVYLYKKGFLHAKMIVCDDELSSVGSTNIDFRSLEQNFEVNAFIYDSTCAKELKAVFLNDQKECMQLTSSMYDSRSRWHRIKESFIRLFSPIL